MKISEMIKNLEEFMEECGDLDCWYAVDDEGNDYHEVYFSPSFKYVDDEGVVYSDEEDFEYFGLSLSEVIPICIVN